MRDFKLEAALDEEVQVDALTLEAIDRGADAADAGRTVSVEEARTLIPEWISKFESQTQRASRAPRYR